MAWPWAWPQHQAKGLEGCPDSSRCKKPPDSLPYARTPPSPPPPPPSHNGICPQDGVRHPSPETLRAVWHSSRSSPHSATQCRATHWPRQPQPEVHGHRHPHNRTRVIWCHTLCSAQDCTAGVAGGGSTETSVCTTIIEECLKGGGD